MKKLGLALALLLPFFASAEFKYARSGDVASQYELDYSGNFYRYVSGQRCQITNGVQEFKVSVNPWDVAMVYFEKDNNLWILRNGDRTGQCPRADKEVLLYNVRKYSVVPNSNSTVVNMALDTYGRFLTWDTQKNVLLASSNITDYVVNECYGVLGRSFNSYVAFALQGESFGGGGPVLKVKGSGSVRYESKWDQTHHWYNLQEFKKKNNVCAYN